MQDLPQACSLVFMALILLAVVSISASSLTPMHPKTSV